MSRSSCWNCGKDLSNVKSDEVEYIDGPRQIGVLEVCRKCANKIGGQRNYSCNVCMESVSKHDIFVATEEDGTKTQICRSCLRYTLLWNILNKIIDVWSEFNFVSIDRAFPKNKKEKNGKDNSKGRI